MPIKSQADTALRVLIVAGEPILRFALASFLSRDLPIKSQREATDGDDVLQQIDGYQPDLVVAALPLGGSFCPPWFRQLREKCPQVKILAGTRVDDPSLAGRAIRAGANGCVCWNSPLPELSKAVRTVVSGDGYLGAAASRQLR